jgi:hypothetical protein
VNENILAFVLFIGFHFRLYPYLDSEEESYIKVLVDRSQIHSRGVGGKKTNLEGGRK